MMTGLVGIIVGAIVGAVCTYFVSRAVHEKHKPTRKIRIDNLSYVGIPAKAAYLFCKIASPVKLDNDKCLVQCYHIRATGNAIINNLRIQATARQGSVVAFCYWVNEEVMCDRLTRHKEPPETLSTEWDYVNPGDVLTLHLLVLGTDDPDDVLCEFDAEGLVVERMPRISCIIPERT